MIDPTIDDVGRKVVYRARHPGAELEEGVITSFNETCVFVRYGADVHSKGPTGATSNGRINEISQARRD